jgi:hypothetical protein
MSNVRGLPLLTAWNARKKFGVASAKPCEVCGKHKNNQVDPVHGHVVCELHQILLPSELKKEKEEE